MSILSIISKDHSMQGFIIAMFRYDTRDFGHLITNLLIKRLPTTSEDLSVFFLFLIFFYYTF